MINHLAWVLISALSVYSVNILKLENIATIFHFRENVNISSQLAQLTEKATNLTAENDKLAVSENI